MMKMTAPLAVSRRAFTLTLGSGIAAGLLAASELFFFQSTFNAQTTFNAAAEGGWLTDGCCSKYVQHQGWVLTVDDKKKLLAAPDGPAAAPGKRR